MEFLTENQIKRLRGDRLKKANGELAKELRANLEIIKSIPLNKYQANFLGMIIRKYQYDLKLYSNTYAIDRHNTTLRAIYYIIQDFNNCLVEFIQDNTRRA